MSSPDRGELIRNAVAFLSDHKASTRSYISEHWAYKFPAQASPLAQKLQFLEAKGLTPPEIDMALKQAALNASGPPPVGYPGTYNPYAPPPQRWDWRDYFITGVVSGAVAYGAASLFKKYLLPHLQPPESTAYEQDRDALTAQFDAAEALLKEIQAETASVRAAVEEQKETIDKTTEDVQAVVTEMREGETKTRDELREMREEINTIREMLPRMIEKNKDSQTQSLGELQQELKSLKALLLSRGPTTPGTPSSPMPVLGRPTIPSWQLASAPATPSVPLPVQSNSSQEAAPSLDKGKGVDRTDTSDS